jgi:hypothetical protein
MSEFRVDQIKNQAGTRGPDVAGITTFSGVSGIVMPSGNSAHKYVDANFVTDGLILQYDFSNINSYPGSGDTVYDMVGGQNGTLYNSPTYSTDKGGYLSLSGSDDYIQVPNGNTIRWDQPHSIEFWVYPLGTGDSSQNLLEADYNNNIRIQFDKSDYSDKGRIEVWVESSSLSGDSNRAYNRWFVEKEWHHLVVTRSDTLGTVYVDGKLDDGTAVPNINASQETSIAGNKTAWNSTVSTVPADNYTGNVFIGRFISAAGTENFDGYIALFSLYQKELSKDEVLQNYNAWRGRYQ